MHVVATAGHVDHGKSTLVEALTGTSPDRLAEEQRRGLTIELGHVWTELDGVGPVAFVDVPGHERFVATTLAGVGPVPAVLFVVAADDPWMPQAAEHLAALDHLGVARGVLAVTRSDLADPAPALAAARAAMASTSLWEMPAVAVSGRTGVGLPELRAALVDEVRRLPTPDPEADVRLWVDRSFGVRGTGTVVTGTLRAGTLRVGDALELWDGADVRQVRVRGLQSLGSDRAEVSGVARVAVALGGDVEAGRGAVLVTPRVWPRADVVDVRLRGGDASGLPAEPVLHVGAARVPIRVRPLSGDLARLRLAVPQPLRIGDVVLLRDPGSRRLWGAEVLDPEPPELRRRGDAVRRAGLLADDAPLTVLATHLARQPVVDLAALRRRGVDVGTAEGRWLVSPAAVPDLRRRLAEAVRRHDAEAPLEGGLPTAAAARLLDLPDPALLAGLIAPPLALDRGRVTLGPAVASEVTEAVARLHEELTDAPFAAPAADRLLELGLTPPVAAAAERAGLVVRLAEHVVLPADAAAAAVPLLSALEQPFTTSEARQALGTSRRVVLPLLGLLDRRGLTRRLPDDRRNVIRTEQTSAPSA